MQVQKIEIIMSIKLWNSVIITSFVHKNSHLMFTIFYSFIYSFIAFIYLFSLPLSALAPSL